MHGDLKNVRNTTMVFRMYVIETYREREKEMMVMMMMVMMMMMMMMMMRMMMDHNIDLFDDN